MGAAQSSTSNALASAPPTLAHTAAPIPTASIHAPHANHHICRDIATDTSNPSNVNILAATSPNLTAIIDPTHPTPTGTHPTLTFSPPVTHPTNTPLPLRYIFTFGDSLTSTGFNISGTPPTPENPLGNPAYPGLTDQPGMQNWVDLLTVHANVEPLTWNFAVGGAAVNNSLTEGANPGVRDGVGQVGVWAGGLGRGEDDEEEGESQRDVDGVVDWDADNSIAIVWFGRNDIYWAVVQDAPDVEKRLDDVMNSYLLMMTRLAEGGVKRFLILGVPPIGREPIWRLGFFRQRAGRLGGDARYWNDNLQRRLREWKMLFDGVSLTWLDTMGVYDTVLDHPHTYGAPDALCTNQHLAGLEPASETDKGNGTNCLWANEVHPGPALNVEVAKTVGLQLQKDGFFAKEESVTGSASGGGSGSTSAPNQNAGPVTLGLGIWHVLLLAASLLLITGWWK